MSQRYTLSDWDTNGDSALDQSEFNTVLEDAGYFNLWDADGDDQISQDEWNQGIDGAFFTPYDRDDINAWNNWDLNNDDSLSKSEFNQGVFATIDDSHINYHNTSNFHPNANNNLIEEDEFLDWYDVDLF